MFVALRKDGTLISLLDKWKENELIPVQKDEEFYCPACKERLQLKNGVKRITHFAHQKGTECQIKTEAESQYHLRGKEQLFKWANTYSEAYLEPYLPKIAQRPDILVKTDEQSYAIEYQCSSIDPNLFIKRTKSYEKIGIIPIWILGAKWLRRLSTNRIALSPFQWLFMTSQTSRRILYYCPESSVLISAYHLSPFTSQDVFTSLKTSKLNAFPLSELISYSKLKTISFNNEWVAKKKNWRIQFSSYPLKQYQNLYNLLYERRIPPAYIPAEAGIEVQSAFWLHTPPIIWQMWILLDLIFPIPLDQEFTFNRALSIFSRRIRSQDILVRTLPLIKDTHYSFSLMEYLQHLTRLKVLEKKDKTTFIKRKEISIPTSMEEAYMFDFQIVKNMHGNFSYE